MKLNSSTGWSKDYIGYTGVSIDEWRHLGNIWRWFYGGLVTWIYYKD